VPPGPAWVQAARTLLPMAWSPVKRFAEIGSDKPPAGPRAGLGTAIVLGGSVAGMLAARVLADHAETVLIIERDPVTAGADARRGVPQSSQVHALLAGGSRQLERWFPGFIARAVAAGASLVPPDQQATYIDGVRKVRGADISLLSGTRPFLEGRIRAELLELPNVKVVTGQVIGLEIGETAVAAVRYESGGVAGRETADLVVDAMGRASRLSAWLESAGWERPPVVRVTTGINYATAFFHRPPGRHPHGTALAIPSNMLGEEVGGAVFSTVEGDRWIVMMGGYGDFRPGSTAADMIRRFRTQLPAPFGHVAANEMVGDVTTYRQADSRRRDFWACERLPARLAVVGDAVASFNPLYGQGMSSAALHASALSLFLRSSPDLDAPARDFLALQRVIVDAAWQISASEDSSGSQDRDRTPVRDRMARRIVDLIIQASVTDTAVNAAFQEVTQMLRHPSALAGPKVVWRAWQARKNLLPAPTPPVG
jgi:2-polyprenyl-6-methoxyphenol hydroxylase-like FAD-dependent oxidoreductase